MIDNTTAGRDLAALALALIGVARTFADLADALLAVAEAQEHPTHAWARDYDLDEFYRLTLTDDPADDDVVQAADLLTFYAAHPHVRHDAADLDTFNLADLDGDPLDSAYLDAVSAPFDVDSPDDFPTFDL